MIWTDARKNAVTEFWQAGYTASQICAALGPPYVTRNAIIGMIHRAGMSRKAGAPSKPREIKRTANPLGARVLKQPSLPSSPVVANKVDIPRPRSRKLTLQKLTSHDCRWPEGDGPFFFCGIRKKEGSAYCEHHDKRAYNKVESTRQQRRGSTT